MEVVTMRNCATTIWQPFEECFQKEALLREIMIALKRGATSK